MSAPLQQQQPQQNVVHQPPPQQQPPIITTTNDIISIESEFSTLHHPNKKIDEQIETNYDILFTCLEANEDWKLVKKDSGGTVLVNPDSNPEDLDNLFEGEAYINSFAYGHRKSDETLNRLNELYLEYVLGTDMGRRLIQQRISSLLSPPPPPKVNTEHKKLAARTLNFMLRELSTTDQTPRQQNEKVLVNTPQQNEKLLVTVEFLLGQLKINQEILLREDEEKKKRQLESVVSIQQQQRDKKRLKRVVDDDNVDDSQDIHTHNNNSIAITPPPPTNELSSKPFPDDATNNVTVKPPAAEQSQTSMPTKTDDAVPRSDLVPYKEEDACEDDEEVEDDDDEEDDESADQQLTLENWKILEKMAIWNGNNVDITQVKQSLSGDEGYEIAKTLTFVVEIATGAEEIGESIASSIDEAKLSPAEIGKQVKQQFKGMDSPPDVFKTCLLDNTQDTTSATSTSKAPIVFGIGRGSKRTNNTGTSQCRNTSEATLALVRGRMLPQNTQLCTDYFFAHECNKDKMHHAPALWHLLWCILHVDQDVQIILAMNEYKRLGRGQLLNKLLLIIHAMHPNTKIVSVRECFMHPNEVTNNNEQDILEYSSINRSLGSNRGQNNGVSVSDEERKRLDRISSRARAIAQQFIDMAKEGFVPKIISDGLKRGREVSEDDESDRNDFKLVIDCAHDKVKDEHTPLSDQPEVHSAIKEQLDELNKQHPIQHSNNLAKAVVIYLRRTLGRNGRSVWGVSLWQLALAIAAGLEDGCITKDTELIIISEDDVLRTNELNPGLSRIMSRIRAGGVSAFIEASTLRGTSRRVVHNIWKLYAKKRIIPRLSWLLKARTLRLLE